jgi:hypothetical protein
MKNLAALVVLLALAAIAFGQDPSRPRVFVTDSKSWETSGGFGGTRGGIGGAGGGGARPQTAEIIKTFNERCPDCTVTINRDKADYIVILEHEGGKSVILKDNKYALFNKDGDAIKSGSARSLGNAVKELCGALTKDWESNRPKDQKTEN